MEKLRVKENFAKVHRSKKLLKTVMTGILILTLFTHCKEKSKKVEVYKKVLLSKIIIPAGYQILYKGPHHPEGESSMRGDSIYIIKKVGDTLIWEDWHRARRYFDKYGYKPRDPEVKLIIKHINPDYIEENANDIFARINNHIHMLTYNNSTTKIHERKVNVQKSIWYINYSYGQPEPNFFYLERKTSDSYIIIYAREHKFTPNDIRILYNGISKFKD